MTTLHMREGKDACAWERYQHRTADLLRELGFTAEVNDPLHTTRGVVHEVDVSARIVLADVEVLWIVEYKLWNRVVPNEKVSALSSVPSKMRERRYVPFCRQPRGEIPPGHRHVASGLRSPSQARTHQNDTPEGRSEGLSVTHPCPVAQWVCCRRLLVPRK
jgi:hypothetical protein